MSDKMMRRTLIVCAGVLVLFGLPMVVMAVVQRDARMGLYGVLSLLFALSNVLQLLIADERSATDPLNMQRTGSSICFPSNWID